jgi:hypothetical protein
MVPIAAIAGEPRGIEAKDGTGVASTKPSNQPIKARSCNGSAGRSAHIVVDDFDVHEAVLTSNLDKIILAPLAFQVDHDLGLRRLAHVDHGLALEHAGGKKISAFIAKLLDDEPCGLHQDLRQNHPDLAPLRGTQSRQLPRFEQQPQLAGSLGDTARKPPYRTTVWGEKSSGDSMPMPSDARLETLSPAWRTEPWRSARAAEREFQGRPVDGRGGRGAPLASLAG